MSKNRHIPAKFGRAVVVVKWSACSPSIPIIWVQIPLKPTVFLYNVYLKKEQHNKKRPVAGPFKKPNICQIRAGSNLCFWTRQSIRLCSRTKVDPKNKFLIRTFRDLQVTFSLSKVHRETVEFKMLKLDAKVRHRTRRLPRRVLSMAFSFIFSELNVPGWSAAWAGVSLWWIEPWRSLVEGDEGCIRTSGKLLCLWQTNEIMQYTHGILAYMFDCWSNLIVHLLHDWTL